MNGQLQFGGVVPFTDRATGQPVQVRVWGVYMGSGVEAHEQHAIQQWIMNALATSVAQYDGNVHELPAQAGEWGAYVSQQIAPGLAQAFQAHGQIHIQGVSIEGSGAPMKSPGAPMAGGKADLAAQALMKQLGMPHDQAYRAAQIVIDALGAGGAVAPDPYAKKPQDPPPQKSHDAYAQKPHDPYDKKPHDPYAQKGSDIAKKPETYAQKAPDPYAKHGAPPTKGPDPYTKKK